jgi:2,4-diketo-3-deoxy-L-fuconate hydrolase
MAGSTPYALGRFRRRGASKSQAEFCGVVVGSEVTALAHLHPEASSIDALLADWPANREILDAAVDEAIAGPAWVFNTQSLDDYITLAPLSSPQIFQSGANYKKHVVELVVAAASEAGDTDPEGTRGRAIELMQERADTGSPYVFLGLASSICGPDDDVVLPNIGIQHDWELELGVIIGTEAYQVERSDAMSHVAGYVIANDLTTRDRVFRPDMPSLGTDWFAGKNAPTFLPLGPWFVPAHFVEDPMALQITLKLNDEIMQHEATADMIFDIATLIEHISAITPMRPGDLLLTGSPAGNGAHYGRYLQPGDVMTSTITGLGTQRNRCVSP